MDLFGPAFKDPLWAVSKLSASSVIPYRITMESVFMPTIFMISVSDQPSFSDCGHVEPDEDE